MHDLDRLELEKLRERHARLEQECVLLARQLQSLELRLQSALPEEPKTAAPPAAPVPESKVEAPATPSTIPPARPERLRIRIEPPPSPDIPPVIAETQAALPRPAPAPTAPAPSLHLRQREAPPGATPRPQATAARQPRGAGADQQGSFELRLGTYWFVRAGIVMVLTALVFFGNLAYQRYITKLGPGGKITLMYLASGLLLGAGAWWQRKAARDTLKNYAQVLFAGGLAAVYFTTYAAYHIEPLRIIGSATLDGALLFGWAAFMVWIADRKKSEVLALFAIGLAYYTSIITRVGYFTLYSNLLLAAAAVFFLVRNRWTALSFGSLAATYTAYAFWRFFDGSAWRWAMPDQGLWTGAWFLAAYWVIFTTAVFASKEPKFAGEKRLAFLTLNNGAFFSLFFLTMLQVREGGFWKFAVIYGSALLVLAEAARRFLAAEPLAKNSYLTQGLLLATIGLISHPDLAGLNLALVLAAESVILLTLGQRRQSRVLRAGAYIVAGLAAGWGIDGMRQSDPKGVWLAIGLGGLMLANAILAARKAWPAPAGALRLAPVCFAALALITGLIAVWNNAGRQNFPVVLALLGVALTFSVYVSRVPEIAVLSQGYLVVAQVAWVFYVLAGAPAGAWWHPPLLVTVSLALSHWWQRQRTVHVRAELSQLWQGLYAIAILGLSYVWLSPKFGHPAWLALLSLLAVGLTAYGVWTRLWWLAGFSQAYVLVSGGYFVWLLQDGSAGWAAPLAPIAALGLLSFSTVQWFKAKPDATGRVSTPLLQTALCYRWSALALSLWWICEFIPGRERIWLLALVGLWIFLWAGWQKNREALLFGAVYTAAALVLFWLPLLHAPKVYWPNLVAMVALLAQRQLARRLPDRYPLSSQIHGAVIIAGGLSLWLFLSRWVLETASGFYLTASWSGLALAFFVAGMLLRERVYRWLGLGVLACAVGRVVFIDVWKIDEPFFRILSFMALGIVLLVLGFLYNKHQEKIREWL
jgi:hypothetical protein